MPQTEEDRRAPKYTGTKPPVDEKYDYEAERKDKQEAERARQKNQQITYVKRLIVHPSFINATYAQVIKYMESQDQGEAIFRPSSKGVYEVIIKSIRALKLMGLTVSLSMIRLYTLNSICAFDYR